MTPEEMSRFRRLSDQIRESERQTLAGMGKLALAAGADAGLSALGGLPALIAGGAAWARGDKNPVEAASSVLDAFRSRAYSPGADGAAVASAVAPAAAAVGRRVDRAIGSMNLSPENEARARFGGTLAANAIGMVPGGLIARKAAQVGGSTLRGIADNFAADMTRGSRSMMAPPDGVGPPAAVFEAPKPADDGGFQQFFSGSKVVGRDGGPLVVYHGTHAKFDEFDPDLATEGGFYFSADEAHAARFGPEMFRANLSMKNPLEVDGRTIPVDHSVEDMERLFSRAEKGGHDGVFIRGFRDTTGKPVDTYIAMRPEQIRRAEAPRPSLAPTDFKPVSRKKYQAAIDAAREKMSPQDRLQVSRIEDDFGGKLYLTPDGKAGFGVAPDGELVALFSSPDAAAKGTMDAALKRGVSEGATHLNAYDTYLAKGYGKRGAVETERNAFNPEYAPEGWDVQTMGTPDYVTMRLPPKGVSVKPTKGLLASNYIANAQRTANPGVYAGPEKVVADLKAKFVPESPLLQELWGVSRDDLYELSRRTGNDEGFIPRAPANPRGNPEAMRIQTPENSDRILADIEAMKDKAPDAYRAAHSWYVMDPAFRRLAELVGPEEAVKRYNRLNVLTPVESPNLAVPSELTRGTAANMMWEQGRFNEWLERGGLPDKSRGVSGLEGVPGRIGGQSIARKQAQLAAAADAGTPLKDLVALLGHKEGPYAHASGVPETGFQTSVPAGDAHFVRGTGLADARTIKPGGKKDAEASVTLPELQSLLDWHRQIARRSGAADAVPAQAIEWLLYAAQTGVKTPVGPGKLEILSQQIAKTAKREGISLQTARDRVLLGKSYAGKVDPALLGLLGIGSAAGAAAYATQD